MKLGDQKRVFAQQIHFGHTQYNRPANFATRGNVHLWLAAQTRASYMFILHPIINQYDICGAMQGLFNACCKFHGRIFSKMQSE